MKYIRTKDGRIVAIPNKHKEAVYDGNVIISVEKIINGVRGEAIVNGIVDRKADTIEELCDVFIKKSKIKKNDYFQIGTDSNLIFDKKYENYKRWFNNYDYYGAIWTDKGLIYVAKMNDKGELELLWKRQVKMKH